MQKLIIKNSDSAKAALEELSDTLPVFDRQLVFFGGTTLVELRVFDGGVHLCSIYTSPEFRGRGQASETLKQILGVLDKHKVRSTLSISVFGSDSPDTALSETELAKWYAKNGYKNVRGTDLYLRAASVLG
jgi:ribosomal protein S18 acetylase RimI-like enzyme